MVRDFQKEVQDKVKRRRERAYISFGPGADLMSEDWLLDQLKPLGMTRRSVRSFVRSLGLPLIWLGNTVFVNYSQFQTAVATASHRGQPDFVAPGSEPIRRNRYPHDVEWTKSLSLTDATALAADVAEDMKNAQRRPTSGDNLQKMVMSVMDPLTVTQIRQKERKVEAA